MGKKEDLFIMAPQRGALSSACYVSNERMFVSIAVKGERQQQGYKVMSPVMNNSYISANGPIHDSRIAFR